MAPSITPPKSIMMAKNSREATPTESKPPMVVTKGDAELASDLKSDLTDIRNLVTCSICDQLLYEPWTLGCGHTYCYSCLCNWFVPNKRKKTCPECRAAVKQMPAPAFLVKQMVEIFIRRGELMPCDESIDQHQKKRAEEIADVDKDRNGAEGLFKGTFPPPKRELIYDEGDGVFRCPRCLTEHEGGPTCANCELAVEPGYDSDVDDDFDPDDLENLEVDLDEAGLGDGPNFTLFGHMRRHMHPHAYFHHPFHFHHHHHHHESEDSDSDSSEQDMDDEDDDEDDGSLREFVVPDDDPEPPAGARPAPPNQRETIDISDDDSDEGGAVSNRRQRRVGNRSTPHSSPSVVSVASSSVSESDVAMLQQAGWSPLDHGNDSDSEVQAQYPSYVSEEDTTEGSDTETIGNGASDDDSDRERSPTPRYEYPTYQGESSDGEDDDASIEGIGMDHDGDTEMSVSPSVDRYRSQSVSTSGYNGYEVGPEGHQSRSPSAVPGAFGYGEEDAGISESSRSVSVDSEQDGPYGYGGEDLGQANEIHEVDDDSSDSSIVPPPRRRQRRQHLDGPHVQQHYDPRISMIFAEHQQIRVAQDPQAHLAQLDDMMRRAPIVEPASRTRRLPAYRVQPLRRVDPLRSSRSPSATRVYSSSSRNSRGPIQYQRRN